MGLFPILCFLLSTAFYVSANEEDTESMAMQVEGLMEGTGVFQSGTKLAGILAREQARLSERITRECDDDFKYRPIDGVCNNLKNAAWGAPLQAMRRLVPAKYHDRQGRPRMYGTGGYVLPSARAVSVALFEDETTATEDRPFSQMIMQWGQFIDHDCTGTPGTGAKNCCSGMDQFGLHPDSKNDRPCMPILIPEGDRQFSKCMEFSRSLPVTQRTETCEREQLNVLTPYLDGGMVYGGSQEELDNLRNGPGGLMKTSKGNFLPESNRTFCVKRNAHSCYNGGDFRLNVFPGLTAMHTLWVREHNRLATELAEINTDWDDETLFQEARKIVIASLQHITYDVYLRETLGPFVYDLFGFSSEYEYDETVNPGIFNSFATAAFRHGHSQIAGHYGVKGDPHKNIAELYMDPSFVSDGLEEVILGVIEIANRKADDKFTTGVTDHLFENTSKAGVSLDLVALNIQRGRDHGLAPYNDFLYKALGVINDASYLADDLRVPKLAVGLYDNVYDLDLYAGGMSETPLKGAMVGPTFAYIIAEQFKHIRNGDRFWYERTNTATGFSEDRLAEIRKVTLARVICDNTDITEIQPDVFRMPEENGANAKVSCTTLPSLDLTDWKA